MRLQLAALCAFYLAAGVYVGCARRAELETPAAITTECTCIFGHPELDWIKDHDQLEDPADCTIHHGDVE